MTRCWPGTNSRNTIDADINLGSIERPGDAGPLAGLTRSQILPAGERGCGRGPAQASLADVLHTEALSRRHVAVISDVKVPGGVDCYAARFVEAGGDRRSAVAGETLLTVAGDRGDDSRWLRTRPEM
jgi:hypothetical protein